MTVARFFGQILLGLFVCFIGFGGLVKSNALFNLIGLAFIFIGGGLILQTIVFAIKGYPKEED